MEDLMAARKKAKAKAKRKKTPARKPATHKKSTQLRKKAARKKPAARRAAPKKRPEARPARPPAQPAGAAAPVAMPAPLPNEQRIGTVTHYYSHLSVAVLRLESASLRVGDTIRILGHTTDFRQRVESMQIEHESVSEVSGRQEFGLKVIGHARENDDVYKVMT